MIILYCNIADPIRISNVEGKSRKEGASGEDDSDEGSSAESHEDKEEVAGQLYDEHSEMAGHEEKPATGVD